MFRPFELFVGLRYLRAKRRNHFISVISLISIVGVAVGVAALIVVLSVMNGFQTEIRERTLSMTSHATVTGADHRLDEWPLVVATAMEHPEVIAAAPYVEGEAMLSVAGSLSGTLLRGIEPGYEVKVSRIADHMVMGELGDLVSGEYGIILGSELANVLQAFPGDRVVIMIAQGSVTPAGITPRLRRFTVKGIFEVGMYEYDRSLALIHMQDASRLFGIDEQVSGVRLKLQDLFQAGRVVREVAYSLGDETYFISDWTRQHTNLYRALKMEKRIMAVILFLIVAVATFNIISTLVMVVTDKQADIAILRTLGASPRSVMTVFMVQGTIIGLLGALLGVSLGIVLALNVETLVPFIEQALGIEFLPGDVYYISDLPSELQLGDVTITAIGSFLLATLATIYPALRAAATQPADALRYE